jgi:hypothetical protein
MFLTRKKLFSGHFSTKKMIFHTTVNPGSGTGIPVLRSSSTVIPVLKKRAGIAIPNFARFQLSGNLLKTKKKCAPYFRGNTQFLIYLELHV